MVKPPANKEETLAMGKPVALEARADEREVLGLISITTTRPVSRSWANWMLVPPMTWKERSPIPLQVARFEPG